MIFPGAESPVSFLVKLCHDVGTMLLVLGAGMRLPPNVTLLLINKLVTPTGDD